MDEQYRQRVDEIAREMIRRGEFENPVNPHRDAELGRNNQDDRNLGYSIRDIPTFDGKGDSLPHTHIVRHNLTVHHSVTPFVIRQPIRRSRLLERVYKPVRTLH